MKANELMIGDWVLVHKPTCKGHRVDYINEMEEEIGADGEIYDVCDIKPIPLTPEILEKNGFRHGCYVGGYYSPDCPFRVFTKTAGKCEFTTLFDDEIHFLCVFVHQLQHALRLCGIDKEIVL